MKYLVPIIVTLLRFTFSSSSPAGNVLYFLPFAALAAAATAQEEVLFDGPSSFSRGKELFQQGKYDKAATELWRAVLLHSNTPTEQQYPVQEVFQLFMQCYIVQNRMADGLAFVASESFQRGQIDMGKSYLEQALSVDPNNSVAKNIQREFASYLGGGAGDESKAEHDDEQLNEDLKGKSPEELYEIGSKFFSEKDFEQCADIFEISCLRSGYTLGPSCANAVYCRSMIVDYGFNGTGFERDMERIIKLTKDEAALYRLKDPAKGSFAWRRATSVHPHMVGLCRYVCVREKDRESTPRWLTM